METNRLVHWTEEASNFFESSSDDSVDLTFLVCHECASQSGMGFEEFVNSINSANIKRKIKTLIIIDCSFLYRHCIPGFAKYSDTKVPTIWMGNNQKFINKLTCNVVLDPWLNQIKSDSFQNWQKQITQNFRGDENGNGIVTEFRDTVIQEATTAVAKGRGTFEGCRDFILEECAHACTYLKNAVIAYPMPLSASMVFTIEMYNLNAIHLSYKISNHARKHQCRVHDYTQLDKDILALLTETLNANFFVVDKLGNFIYKNNMLSQIVEGVPANIIDPDAWRVSLQVMETGKKIIVEEWYRDTCFLSTKVPLLIDGRIEGVIGFAVDITDQKRAQKLESQNKLQKKIQTIVEQVSHDLCSPLVILDILSRNCQNLSEKEYTTLRNAITSMKNITKDLLQKYGEEKRLESIDDRFSEQYISIYASLLETLNNKRYQYRESNVTFNFSCDPSDNFVFVRGDFSHFCRMISNILNNSVDAIENKLGLIEVSFSVKNQKVKISIKDNGSGMPQEMVDKILNNVPIGTTKASGHGIGMQQVKSTLQQMNGQISIESTENIGTEITLVFPKTEPPLWAAEQIVLHKDDTVVVLDDDSSIHSIWKNRLKDYSGDIIVKYFSQGNEAIDFINSQKEKDKIFLLTDYELRNQDINGIDVIEETDMQQRSIVITSVYIYQIKNFSEKATFIKMASKLTINEIPVVMKEQQLK